MRWVGIDEAGYGPNLGPLVMAAVVAESPDDRRPDLWGDLPATVCRAGGDSQCLWVDDSKRLHQGVSGLERLETASLATLAASGSLPVGRLDLGGFLRALDAGQSDDVELTPWLNGVVPADLPHPDWSERTAAMLARQPLAGAPWRIVAARAVIIGPARFNAGLALGGSKAQVHAGAFQELLRWAWDQTAPGTITSLRADKHGGRHFYAGMLADAVPEAWIVRGPEGPALSRYALVADDRRLEVDLLPRADADDGLVALASILSKTLRERWMAIFNAHWCARVPGLRPTAGYPLDARRFREAIAPLCQARGLGPHLWWRSR